MGIVGVFAVIAVPQLFAQFLMRVLMVVVCFDGIREYISSALRAVAPAWLGLVGLGIAWLCSVSHMCRGGAVVLDCFVSLCLLFDAWLRSLTQATLLLRSVDRRRGAALAGMMFTGLVAGMAMYVGMVMHQYASHRCTQLCIKRCEVSSRRYVQDCCDDDASTNSVSFHWCLICLSLSLVGAWGGAIGAVLVPSLDWGQVYLALSPTP